MTDAFERVLAEPVYAAVSALRRDVSAMDGFAVRNAEAAVGARLWLWGGGGFCRRLASPAIVPGEAVRVFTEAAMPDAANRVIVQENCTTSNGVMTIDGEFEPGWHVRKKAGEFAEPDLLKWDEKIRPNMLI